MRFLYESITSSGGRPYNEDSVHAQAVGKGLLAIVADGLGSHGGGDIASALAVHELCEYWRQNDAVTRETLLAGFGLANQAVLAAQTPGRGMRTTAVLLLCNETEAAVAHIGDSRCYHFAGGHVAFQTTDHSVSQLAVDLGEITPAQIRFHEDRNRLYRALGNERPPGKKGAEVKFLHDLKDGDAFLLCSDGFWEYVEDDEMEADLQGAESPRAWVTSMLARIGARVDGANDNLSAIGVILRDGPREA